MLNSSSSSSVDVGLGILIQLSHGEPNVVIKPTKFKLLRNPTFHTNRIDPPSSSSFESSFLKSCHLCNKNLCPNKDVYMYRGNQGFCSVECRSRKIYLDHVRETEACAKKMVTSFRQCRRNAAK
ncbi:hypothetical protein U1Q18_026778 [Sarracenia purpurea var. burkii]